jgi:mannose-6-phosphate isomerase-like protein (cupin superfamily)
MPEPGDVIVIDKLNVVHSVIGCTLVEFATVSTDMVDRLHDQNRGHEIPPEYSRDFTEDRLRHLSWPDASQRVTFERGGWCRRSIPALPIKGGVRTVFDDGDIGAASFRIDPGAGSDLNMERERAVCLHVVDGAGRLVLGDEGEVRRVSPPTLTARAGDLFFVAPGAHYGFVNDGTAPLTVAEHKILSSTAFV